jgi:type IV secretion system protein VirB4
MLVELNGVKVTPDHRKEITSAIENMKVNGQKTLLEFQLSVQSNEIKSAVEMYTSKGMMGYMLDAERDELDLSGNGGLTVFEIEELMGMGDAKYNLPVLLYLFRRVEKSLKGQPAAIFLDEAWLMLSHAVFRDKIREWFKVLRKANCAIILATQSLSDAVGSGILDVIRESTATKIFLPNTHAKGADTADVYRSMGLNPQQINIISTAIPKRQYYYTSENGNRLFELALGPLALSLVAVSDKDSVATIRKLEAELGDDWLPEWLKLRGLPPDTVQTLLPEGHKFKKGMEHEFKYKAV